jgi:hypothetical protein
MQLKKTLLKNCKDVSLHHVISDKMWGSISKYSFLCYLVKIKCQEQGSVHFYFYMHTHKLTDMQNNCLSLKCIYDLCTCCMHLRFYIHNSCIETIFDLIFNCGRREITPTIFHLFQILQRRKQGLIN